MDIEDYMMERWHMLSGRIDREGTVIFVGDTSPELIQDAIETLKQEWPEIERVFTEIPLGPEDRISELGWDENVFNLHEAKVAHQFVDLPFAPKEEMHHEPTFIYDVQTDTLFLASHGTRHL